MKTTNITPAPLSFEQWLKAAPAGCPLDPNDTIPVTVTVDLTAHDAVTIALGASRNGMTFDEALSYLLTVPGGDLACDWANDNFEVEEEEEEEPPSLVALPNRSA